jgi:hypothetical protein
MKNVIKTIEARYSVRNYIDKPIEKEKLDILKSFIEENKKGPMGNEVTFHIIDASEYDKAELKSLITYGMIKGSSTYVVGVVKPGEYAMEDFGYCMEKIILKATELGLGTCWLGGTFNRGGFAKKVNLSGEELLPSITPIGYTADKKTMKENIIRTLVGAKKRKKPEELFFSNNVGTSLNLDTIGAYAKVLEAVRIGPSASNKQPWRIIKDSQNFYHIFSEEDEKYNNTFNGIKIQNIDMGIAMCHFELSAKELGITGQWVKSKPEVEPGKLKYIVTWKEN